MRKGLSNRTLIVVTAAAVIALDAGTKALAVHFLAGGGSVNVLGGAFHLELYRNFAGPHNTLEGHPVLVSVLALAAVAAIVVLAGRVRAPSAAVAVGLLLGGGIGNLLDRVLRAPGPFRGGVIDWLRPAWSSGSMNVADLSIFAAILLMVAGAAGAWWRGRHRQIAPTV